MKSFIGILLSLCMLPALGVAQEPSSSQPPMIVKPDRFDAWSDLRFNEEKARLDRIGRQAKEWGLSIVYLVIHAGQTACAGEARARGIRAKNYLIASGIPNERIVWIDAGWRKNVSVEVWIWPPELGKPTPVTALNLKPSEVKLQKTCKIRYRGN